jgi:hypothetical protein
VDFGRRASLSFPAKPKLPSLRPLRDEEKRRRIKLRSATLRPHGASTLAWPMMMLAVFFKTLSISLEISRLLLLSLRGRVSKPESARTGLSMRRLYFDVRFGGSVLRDDVGVCGLSADDALADAIEAVEELGRPYLREDIGADETVVRDEDGDEVGRIDLSQLPRRSDL